MIRTGVAFITRRDALAFVESKDYGKRFGVMGYPGKASDISPETLVIYDNYKEYLEKGRDVEGNKRRKQILANMPESDRALFE